jgi:RNA binding exosome subunit
MKKSSFASLSLAVLLCVSLAHAGLLDDLMKGAGVPSRQGPDDSTVVSGLKEALSIGTENAVKDVSRVNGYFGNEIIKILMPEKIQKVANVLKQVGYQKEVDDFVLSMNRAAEKAAPMATSYFVGAIKEMSFDDARKILNGGDTAATEFFRQKTSDKIAASFRPVVSSSMNEVGVTKKYKDMMGKYESLPVVDKQSIDLDSYVTDKAMDGLFYMVGEEEKKIRTDPAARVTDLLKTVFGK